MKKILMIMILITMFGLGACSSKTVTADDQTAPLQIWAQNNNGNYSTMYVVDKDTGVNYIVVSGSGGYGGDSPAIAITPRLKANGSLYISN
jgi:ABC-type glycerol-3-phosphate transport system substrate-binding protein